MKLTLAMLGIMGMCTAGAGIAQAGGLSAEGTRVFTTEDGVEVALVELSPKGAKKYLIRITGSGTELDGKVLPYTLEQDGDDRYATPVHGRTHYYVQQEKRRGTPRWIVYLPGRRDATSLALDEKKSKDFKVKDLFKAHEKQLADKSIENFARFDRPAEEKRHNDELAKIAAEAGKKCGTTITAKIDWSQVDEATMKEYSISGYCEDPLEEVGDFCKDSAEAKAMLAFIKKYTCKWSKGQEFKLGADSLEYITSRDASNAQQHAREFLLSNVRVAGAPAVADEASSQLVPWGKAQTLGERIALDHTDVCTDGKSHFVAIAPDPHYGTRLLYNDGKKTIPVSRGANLPGAWFLDPRFRNGDGNPDFRGVDLRNYSRVELDKKANTCTLHCGARKIPLSIIDSAAREKLLLSTGAAPSPNTRVPHQLGRDRDGKYYYVDKGNTVETEKNFRLFVGTKGNMKLQKMVNVVSDSSGEIFSTKTGQLKFIIGPNQVPEWIVNKRSTKLTLVPIEQNLPLIYNELGVYLTTRMGTPCDDI